MRKVKQWRFLAVLLVAVMLVGFLPVGNDGVQATGTVNLSDLEGTRQVAEWKAGQAYSIGNLVSYQGNIYKCTIPHTGQQGWEPGVAASLWEKQSGNVTPTSTPISTPTPTLATPIPTTGLKVSGYIHPDFAFSQAAKATILSGFKVEIIERGLSTQTDSNGYFEIGGMSASTSANYTIKISKENYLQRAIPNVVFSGNIEIGSQSEPVGMWAGDMVRGGQQDNAINMSDIMEVVRYFNSAKGDGKYNEASDLNKDNAINMTDIMIVVRHFNTTSANYPAVPIKVISTPTATPQTPTPETPTPTATAKPTPTTTTGIDDPLAVGESRTLTDEQIQSLWDGIDPNYAPEKAASAVQGMINRTQYEELFPMRIGSQRWHEFANKESYYKPNQEDYYSYDNFIAAVKDVSNIKYKVVYRQGSTWLHQIYRLDKAQKKETKIYQTKEFYDDWVLNKPLEIHISDFGSFLKEGIEKDRQRELAAFLANIAHETGGGWATAPGGMLSWGLYWNEEVSYIGGNLVGYVDGANKDYPPVAGKSYHGRGPIQLSWNYNYGLFSAIIYGDKNILLQNPDKIIADGKLGFMTAMLFWMTPQAPKPSCHDIMVGNWTPSAEEQAKGLTPSFGATIMVINGGLEGNKGLDDYRVGRRAGHYKDITSKMGVNISGEKLDTLGMSPF